MKFTRLRLSNFKCYAEADLGLNRGVTVIHGLNGSGKTTLLEACFFALYGSKALDARTLNEVITNGEEEAEIELWFTHDGLEHRIDRRLRVSGERAQTVRCDMETPDGTVSGARDVRRYVSEMLRMDAEAFVNCAYVRQGEVNKLIHATPRERQDMIDELLQLGVLETYRERASQARLGVRSVRDGFEGSRRQLDVQIEEKEEKDLPGTLNSLESELVAVEAEIERFEEQVDEAERTWDEASDILERYEDRRTELDELESELESLRESISETEAEREERRRKLSTLRERKEEKKTRLDELYATADVDDRGKDVVRAALDRIREEDENLRDSIEMLRVEVQEHASTADALADEADALEERATAKREQANEFERELEADDETLAERREKLETLETEIESKECLFEAGPIEPGEAKEHLDGVREGLEELREHEASVRATIETERERIREAEELLDVGKCPECGQDVQGSPHVHSIDEDRKRVRELEERQSTLESKLARQRERLDEAEGFVEVQGEIERLRDNRSSLQQLIDERETAMAEKRHQIETLRTDASKLEDEAEEARDEVRTERELVEARRERIATVNERRSTLKERIERFTEIESCHEAYEELESKIERHRENRERLAELNDERKRRLSERRERKRELQESFDDERIEAAHQEKRHAEEVLEMANRKLDELGGERSDLQSRIGGVKAEFDELDALREQRAQLVEKLDALERVYEEAETLQGLYGDLRAELRKRNVDVLERMLNETFDLVYQNDSYARIELDGDYALTVYQKDGAALEPEQLSGGERALFNLSLRCAIYRLLAEGIEGAAPMPPLILDEPTVFLDSGHVTRLVSLVDSMRALGVEQIVVVSHDDELVGAADELVTVEKDPTTNRSSIVDASATAVTSG